MDDQDSLSSQFNHPISTVDLPFSDEWSWFIVRVLYSELNENESLTHIHEHNLYLNDRRNKITH
jgi:hypothetical protein